MTQKRADIKQKFPQWLEKVKEFYRKHPKPILIGGGALGLIIILAIVLSLTVFKKTKPPPPRPWHSPGVILPKRSKSLVR